MGSFVQLTINHLRLAERSLAMKLNGAEIVVECLKEQKVKHIFGYPGAATINIYDELYKNEEYIQHILTSHEQGAAHAADGYARSTGKVGVCLATSGPGATNLVTGVATAYMDSVPMVAITGNVQVDMLGKDSFQEVDIQGITMPVTKHNFMVKDINQLADTIRDAFYIAKSGRPGPVLVDIPKNLTWEKTEFEFTEPKEYIPKTNIIVGDTIYEMIEKSVRPMILAGGGVIRSGANKELVEFAEKLDAQVSCTLMGIGSMPYSHPQYMGNIGMHGSLVSNRAINEADLLIVAGARFSDRVVGEPSGFAAY
jgi:acetolactate synthase-1/2/3 large subunit